MPIQLVKISDLTSFSSVDGTILLVGENGSGVEGSLSIQDVLNLVPTLDPSLYMLKSVYDTNSDGIVNNSSQLNSQDPSYYLTLSNQTEDATHRVVTDAQIASWDGKIDSTLIGASPGVAPIGTDGFIPQQFIKTSVVNYVGTWDAATNTPTLADNTGIAKQAYIVSVGATRNLGSGNIVFATSDVVIHNGSIWQKYAAAAVGVTSVNGKTGVVILTTADIPASTDKNYVTDIQKQGLDAAPTPPSTSNPFVTKNDLNTSALVTQNGWNANTNTPTLSNGTGTVNQAYICTTAGSTNFGAGAIPFVVGDLAVYGAGGIWFKVSNGGVGVGSWNGFTGIVVVTTTNLPDAVGFRYVTEVQKDSLAAAQAAGMNSTTARIALLTDITITSPTNFQNSWNAATNTPTLIDGTGSNGDAYYVSVAGTQNLGSGSQTFAIGDFVIYNAANDWVKAPSAGIGVSSVNSLTGAVNLTTNVVPDFLNKRYVSDSTRDAGAAAISPSTSNPFVTTSVLNSAIASVNIQASGKGVISPDVIAKTMTYGDGTSRLLSSVINPDTGVLFTNISAATYFNLVSGITTAWQLDSAIIDQCFRLMEGVNPFSKFESPANKIYILNQHHLLPQTKASISTNRSFSFIFDGQGCVFIDANSTAGILFDRQPDSQSTADSIANNYIQYSFHFKDIQINGSNGARQDVGMRLGATYGSTFTNVGFYNCYVGLKMYFNLQTLLISCKFSDNVNIGCLVSSGIWTGDTIPNSGSNGTSFIGCKFRCATGSFAGVSIYGSDGVSFSGAQGVFEGSGSLPLPTHHIFADGGGSTVVKMLTVQNIHFEQKCTRSNILIQTNPQTYTLYVDGAFVQGVNSAFIELNTNNGGVLQCRMQNVPDNSSQFLLRQSGSQSSFWVIDYARLVSKNNAYDPSNWDLTTIAGTAGTIPLAGRVYLDPNVQVLN